MIGTQTLTVWSAAPGALDRKGIPTPTYTASSWIGCSLQPMEVHEEVTNIDFLINKFRAIGPPTASALALKTTDYVQNGPIGSTTSTSDLDTIQSNGPLYRVIGTKVPPSRKGTPHHVEALLEDPSGLNAP